MPDLSNSYLEVLCRALTEESFFGVTPCDMLPSLVEKVLMQCEKFSVIVNTAPSTVPQGHFIGLSFNGSDSKCLFFDSLALKTTYIVVDPNIQLAINMLKSRYPRTLVVEVKNPLQSLEASSMCGFYAAAFILSQDVRVEEKFEDFVARYTAPKNNLIANDKIAVNYIIEFIHLYGVKKK